MTKRLKLQFADEKGTKRMISIDNPKEDIDDAGVNQAMDEIIASETLATKDGKVSRKVKAYLENVDVNVKRKMVHSYYRKVVQI